MSLSALCSGAGGGLALEARRPFAELSECQRAWQEGHLTCSDGWGELYLELPGNSEAMGHNPLGNWMSGAAQILTMNPRKERRMVFFFFFLFSSSIIIL